jgi:hypothetical protein
MNTSWHLVTLATLAVAFARGTRADTILDFDVPPVGVSTNVAIPQEFGDNVLESGDGIVVDGFGTPNIGLSWLTNGGSWHYYSDAVWASVQLDDSYPGDTHSIVFAPNNPAARVVIQSFSFFPYYTSNERFTYQVTLFAGATVISGPTSVTFISDATKDHPVALNFTGAPGQTIELRLDRVVSVLADGETEGDGYNIAIDDIVFAQDPPTLLLNGPQVTAVSPADKESGVAGPLSYRAEITNGDTAVVPASVTLKLDGVLVAPAPQVTPTADGATVDYQAAGLMDPGSSHTYVLTFTDNGEPPATFTHSVQLTVAEYPSLPAGYAAPTGTGTQSGFTWRTVLAPPGTAALDGTLARAQAQLNGTLIDPVTELPLENAAEIGPNPDGSFDVDSVVDFDDDSAQSGHFQQESLFPGLPVGGNNDFASEGWFLLDLPAGYHRFGVNSDDGFEVSVGTPAQGEFTVRTVLGFFDGGRSAGDTTFDFLVQEAGLYRFRLVFFEIGGAASCEFYSTNLGTGERSLINDLALPGAIRSYRSISTALPPRIVTVLRTGPDLEIHWVDGTPPFQVQLSHSLANGTWENYGIPTQLRTAIIPISGDVRFIRVVGR